MVTLARPKLGVCCYSRSGYRTCDLKIYISLALLRPLREQTEFLQTGKRGEKDKMALNINKATAFQMMQMLPGIGAKRAAQLVALREKEGRITPSMLVAVLQQQPSEKLLELIDFDGSASSAKAVLQEPLIPLAEEGPKEVKVTPAEMKAEDSAFFQSFQSPPTTRRHPHLQTETS